jgi:hypothetical protein
MAKGSTLPPLGVKLANGFPRAGDRRRGRSVDNPPKFDRLPANLVDNPIATEMERRIP